MSKQTQSSESDQDKKQKPQVEPLTNQSMGELASPELLPIGSSSVAGGGSIEGQASLLGGRRWQSAQQQAIAARIGRTQGNRHLQRVISSNRLDQKHGGQSIQRQPKAGDDSTATDGKPTPTQIAQMTMMQPNITKAATNATSRHKVVTSFVQDGLQTVGKIEQDMNHISSMYGVAYKEFAAALAKAEQQAEDQKKYRDWAVGVTLAVAGGLTLGVALEGVAAINVATKIAVDAGSEVAEIVGGEVVGLGTEGGDEAENQLLQPTDGTEPGPKELEHWKLLTKLSQEVAKLSLLTEPLNQQTANATKVDGEIQAYITGGQGKLPADKVIEAVDKVNAMDTAGQDVGKKVDEVKKSLTQTAADYAKAAGEANARKMEQDLWLTWMASLPPNSRVLDYNAIEDRLHEIGVLGHNSVLGLDFGSYTFDAEEELALSAARDRVRYNADGPVVVDPSGAGGASQESEYRKKAERDRYSWMLPKPGEGQGGAPPNGQSSEQKDEENQGQGGASPGR